MGRRALRGRTLRPVELEPLDPLEAIATTRAIRRYRDEPVPDDVLNAVLFAASRAPTGSNRQSFRFLVLRDGDRAAAAKRILGAGARLVWNVKRERDGGCSVCRHETVMS